MIVLGVDPGSNATGYSFIVQKQRDLNLLAIGTIKPRAKDRIEYRLKMLYETIDELIHKYNPDVLVLEKIYSHAQHPATIGILGHVRGIVCLLCAQRNVELSEYSVKRIRKAVVGNGNATKQQTQRIVSNIFKIDFNKISLDASDALALALGYIYMNRQNI